MKKTHTRCFLTKGILLTEKCSITKAGLSGLHSGRQSTVLKYLIFHFFFAFQLIKYLNLELLYNKSINSQLRKAFSNNKKYAGRLSTKKSIVQPFSFLNRLLPIISEFILWVPEVCIKIPYSLIILLFGQRNTFAKNFSMTKALILSWGRLSTTKSLQQLQLNLFLITAPITHYIRV